MKLERLLFVFCFFMMTSQLLICSSDDSIKKEVASILHAIIVDSSTSQVIHISYKANRNLTYSYYYNNYNKKYSGGVHFYDIDDSHEIAVPEESFEHAKKLATEFIASQQK